MTAETPEERKSYKRLGDVSDADGTREAGLVFCIAVIIGMMVAATVNASALTSFWVWFALLGMACAVAINVQALVARAYRRPAQGDEDQAA